MSDQRDADNIRHSQEADFHVPGGIRNQNPIKQTAAGPSLKPRDDRCRYLT